MMDYKKSYLRYYVTKEDVNAFKSEFALLSIVGNGVITQVKVANSLIILSNSGFGNSNLFMSVVK